jgi:hypothetical protein
VYESNVGQDVKPVIYVPAHLDDERVFTSVVTLTFRVARDQT